jgi:hypothetical protein
MGATAVARRFVAAFARPGGLVVGAGSLAADCEIENGKIIGFLSYGGRELVESGFLPGLAAGRVAAFGIAEQEAIAAVAGYPEDVTESYTGQGEVDEVLTVEILGENLGQFGCVLIEYVHDNLLFRGSHDCVFPIRDPAWKKMQKTNAISGPGTRKRQIAM